MLTVWCDDDPLVQNIYDKDIIGPLTLQAFFTAVIMNLWRPRASSAPNADAYNRRARWFALVPAFSFLFDMIENWCVWTLLQACAADSTTAACQQLQGTARVGSIASILKWVLVVPIVVSVGWGLLRCARRKPSSASTGEAREHSQ